VRIIKILPIVNGVTAIKYAIGEVGGDDLVKGEKVFIKICVRRSHRSLDEKLVERFNKIAGYKNEKINRILFLKQGILLNFIVSSYVEDLVELGDFVKTKEFKVKGVRERVKAELEKMKGDLKKAKIEKMKGDLKKAKIVHNDVHLGNVIVVGKGKDLYLALTDFSWVKEFGVVKEWKETFEKTDGVGFLKLFDLLNNKKK
jgi:hypothetical protein